MNGAASPARAADKFCFFDVDETLVAFKTMHSFLDYYLRHNSPVPRVLGPYYARRARRKLAALEGTGAPREAINRAYYGLFRGHEAASVREAARRWFRELRQRTKPFYLPATLRLAREHRASGCELVLVSGSSVDILAPIAEELSAHHVLATRMSEVDGHYTGEIIPPQTIGVGKATAVSAFLSERGLTGRDCFAYGDHTSDFEMLALVGHPVVVTRDPMTTALARLREFSTIDPYEATGDALCPSP